MTSSPSSTDPTNAGYSLMEVLDPEFIPSKLTKSQLRSLLLEYGDIPMKDFPPANIKKDTLIEIFEERIVRRGPEISSHRRTPNASVSGIISVASDGTERRLSIGSANFSSENPFQSPVRSPARGRPVTPIKEKLSRNEGTTRSRSRASSTSTRKRSSTPHSSTTRSSTPRSSSGSETKKEVGRKRRSSSVIVEVIENPSAEKVMSPLFKTTVTRKRYPAASFKESEASPRKSSPSRVSSASPSAQRSRKPLEASTTATRRVIQPDPAYSFMMAPGTFPSFAKKIVEKRKTATSSFSAIRRFFLICFFGLLGVATYFFVSIFATYYSSIPFCRSPIARMVAETFYEASPHSSDHVFASTPMEEAPWKSLLVAPIHKYFNYKDGISICWECPPQASCIPGTTSWNCEPGYAPGRSWLTARPVCNIDYKQQGAVDALVLAIEALLRRILGEHFCAGGDLDSAPFVSSVMLADRFRALDGPWIVNATSSINPNIPPIVCSHRFEAFLAAALARIAGRTESFEIRTLPVDREELPKETWFRARTPSFSFGCRFRLFCMRHRLLVAVFIVIISIVLWIKRALSSIISFS